MFARACLLPVALILFSSNSLFALDPGVRDTVIVSGGPLRVGVSLPIFVSIVNDETISSFTTGFEYKLFDSGMAVYDSVVWVNRMSDPTVIAFRAVNIQEMDGISPDSILIGAAAFGANSNSLPAGSGVIAEIYFTGISEGIMAFDSVFVLPGGDFILVGKNSDNTQVSIKPEFRTKNFLVLPNVIPPSQILSSPVTQATAGSAIGLQVEPVSEFSGSMIHQLLSFRGFDDTALAPSLAPSFLAGEPSTFSWTPMMSDVGIWSATFSLCDTTGLCDTVSAEIQVVASASQLIQLVVEEIPDAISFTGLLHGNFDGDPEPEIVVTGDFGGGTSVIRLYDNTGDGNFVQSYDFPESGVNVNPQVGFINNDDKLDAVMVGHRARTDITFVVKILLGDGSSSLVLLDKSESSGRVRGSVLGEFTGDQFQDFVTVGGGRFSTQVNKVRLFKGNSQSLFEFVSEFAVSDTAYTVSSADFNGDGYADIAVGQFDGLSIYLNNGSGVFTQSAFYPLEFGVTGIDVTNQGADFNRDNNYDLCVTAPSVGGAASEIVVYLGAGDGTFNPQPVRRVMGQVLGNVVGDFNSDGDLDIAYINAALKHIGILFGDGNGAFPNELRFSVPSFIPRVLDATDVDLDGDMDILVGSAIVSQSSGFSIFVYKNQSNPGGLSSSSLDITGLNNAQLELRSPSGRWLNSFGGTMASGEYYQRNINGDNLIDDFSSLASVETGEHTLIVTPKPNLPAGEPFSLEYTINGELFRLVDQAPMPMAGYEFALYPAGFSSVQPRSGSFSYNISPILTWPGAGVFDFEFASDIEFSNVLHSAQVSETPFSLPLELSEPDTTLYYWRVKPVGQPEYDAFFALNVINSEISCGDADGSGKTNIADITFLIARIFAGGPEADPAFQGDADGSGKTNIADITYLISFIFAGGLPPVCP